MTRGGKRSRRSRYKKRRVKPFWAELKSAAGNVGSAVSSGIHGAAEAGGRIVEEAKPYVGAGLAIAGTAAAALLAAKMAKGGGGGGGRQVRRCPPGYYLGPGNRCYLTSSIPRGPAPPPQDVRLTTPGTLAVPSQESFGSSLRSAAPAVVRGQGRVNGLRIEGITFTARQTARTKRQMGMVGGIPGAGGVPMLGVEQDPGLRMSLSSGYTQMEEDRRRREGAPSRMKARRKKYMLDRAMEMGGYYHR